jgi:phenylpropionate dioxygenase-like ring-hydroxylating dioxygenase large terminal subunit
MNVTPYDWDFLVQPHRINRRVYTEEAIFKREMVNVFAGTWVCVGHESEIPKPRDFLTRRFGGRPVIITRDKDGEIHILFNRCAHKGATVCREASGQCKTFVCPYHGWSYDQTGKSIAVPMDHAYADRANRSRFNLLKAPRVKSYRGFIFGTLNEKVADLDDYLTGIKTPFNDWIDRYGDGDVIVRGTQTYQTEANWKFVVDNQGDGYHPAFSHRSLLAMASSRYGSEKDMSYFFGNADETPMFCKSFGNGHYYIDQRPEMHADSAWDVQRPQPGREHYEKIIKQQYGEEEGSRLLELAVGAGMNLTVFPNLLFIGNQFQLVDPVSVNETNIIWFYTHVSDLPDEINTMRLRSQEDFPIFGEVDDVENFEQCQNGLGIPEDEWVDCSRHLDSELEQVEADGVRAPVSSDLTMRTFYKEWQRLMRDDLHIDLSGQRADS